MKTFTLLLTTLILVGLLVGGVFAFTCHKLQKEANESIAKAESAAMKVTDEREKGRAMAIIALATDLVKQSEADHKEAADKKNAELHYRAEAKAKAAKSLADLVK